MILNSTGNPVDDCHWKLLPGLSHQSRGICHRLVAPSLWRLQPDLMDCQRVNQVWSTSVIISVGMTLTLICVFYT